MDVNRCSSTLPHRCSVSGVLTTIIRKVRYISVSTPSRCEPSMNGHPALYGALLMLSAPILCTPVIAADAAAGKTLFQQQCSVCHTAEPNDNGGAQGPSLIGVYGRHAGSDSSFGYTKALQDSKLTWNAGTLNRFLASPSKVVPGTAMV